MADLIDILAYLVEAYPNKGDLANARVTKMVYLSDWKHALEHGRQLSDIAWYFDNYGPFVWDVKETAQAHPDLFRLVRGETFSGAGKLLIVRTDREYEPKLAPAERRSIDYVIQATKNLPFLRFVNLVYSTYPILTSDRYSPLDLPALAREYKATGLYKPQPA
jgi:hypothetical protein